MNVPPLDNITLTTFIEVAGTAKALVVKSNVLNQLPVVNVWILLVPGLIVKLGALLAEAPAVVPNVNVLVIVAVATNPPVPV